MHDQHHNQSTFLCQRCIGKLQKVDCSAVIDERLRSKIEKDFDKPLLKTIRGSGYMIKSDP